MSEAPLGSGSTFTGPEPHLATVLMRDLLDQSDKYTDFMGQALEVNETDFKAMEALMENGPLTAGQLAQAVGVSPGAATSVIDRLVSVGHVTREHNQNDRRGIVVVPNPKSLESAWSHLAPIISASEETIRGMNPESQKAVIRYLESMIEAFRSRSAE